MIEETLKGLVGMPATPERAKEIGHLGYMHWLASLPPDVAYEACAVRAYLTAMDYRDTDPAVEVFCELIRASLQPGIGPLDLMLPARRRRGGARTRRMLP